MSEYQTPIGPIFELQRETIKRGADLLQFPRRVRDELSQEGLAASEQAGTQLLELSRQSIHQSLTVAERVQVDGQVDSLRRTVDEVFDGLEAHHERVYDTVTETYEQTETETMTRGAEQLTILLNLNRRLERQLVEAVEEIETQANRSDDVATEITEQVERLSEQLDRQTERYNQLQAELRESVDLTASEDAETTADAEEEETTAEEEITDGSVHCRVCENSYDAITHSHLQTHGMTVEEYRAEFGSDVPM
jgi:predicted transcriptional regulator